MIANLSAYRTINGTSTPNSEVDIEMQAVEPGPDDHGDSHTESHLDPEGTLTTKRALILDVRSVILHAMMR